MRSLGKADVSGRNFVVRRARTNDAAEIARLAESTFTETFGHLYPPEDLTSYLASAYTPEACLATLADARMAYWLVAADGVLGVGQQLLQPQCSGRISKSVSGRLGNLLIHPRPARAEDGVVSALDHSSGQTG